jgi:hypothetical protein
MNCNLFYKRKRMDQVLENIKYNSIQNFQRKITSNFEKTKKPFLFD